jgi:hypothetical protein
MANEAMMAQVLRQDPVPKPEMLGTGSAGQAGRDIQMGPAYKRYAAEAMMEGSSPKSYEEWLAEQ